MKAKKTTIISFVLAAVLIAGTATAFATSAQAEADNGKVTELAPITKKQFVELVDRHLNNVETEVCESSLMSYVDPTDGKTYYSFDDGKTFEPMTDEEFEVRFPTPNVEWWTYDEYKAWLDNEKVQLRSLLGEAGTFGPYETDEELLAAVKPFCEKQVQLGNMEQSEADEIIARYSGK